MRCRKGNPTTHNPPVWCASHTLSLLSVSVPPLTIFPPECLFSHLSGESLGSVSSDDQRTVISSWHHGSTSHITNLVISPHSPLYLSTLSVLHSLSYSCSLKVIICRGWKKEKQLFQIHIDLQYLDNKLIQWVSEIQFAKFLIQKAVQLWSGSNIFVSNILTRLSSSQSLSPLQNVLIVIAGGCINICVLMSNCLFLFYQ